MSSAWSVVSMPPGHRHVGDSRFTYQPRKVPAESKNHHVECHAPVRVLISTPVSRHLDGVSIEAMESRWASGILRNGSPSSVVRCMICDPGAVHVSTASGPSL